MAFFIREPLVKWQVQAFILVFLFDFTLCQIRYSVPEEMRKGAFVGNVAEDLGIDVKRLTSGGARIVSSDSSEYVRLDIDKGILVVGERIDREQLCGQTSPCSLNFEMIMMNPMQLHSVVVNIQDQNDNPPQVLYPVQTGGSVVAEMVPRAADVGYLVTKVVAVDVDSGQNAWLSYKLQKATDRALFEVGLQNGEIRTIRQVNDKDAVKQRLTVIVEDNGQPSRSAAVIVNVAVADSFPEVLSEFTDFTHDKEYNDNLTFYLVLALAVVSFLFITCVVVIISVKIYRWRQSRTLYHSNLPVIPYYPPRYSDTLGTGTLQHVYNYEVCRTTDSRKSDCKFGRAGSQNVLIMDPSSTGTMQRIQSEKSILDEPDSPLEVSEIMKPVICCCSAFCVWLIVNCFEAILSFSAPWTEATFSPYAVFFSFRTLKQILRNRFGVTMLFHFTSTQLESRCCGFLRELWGRGGYTC
ncbi:protocadherin gamma-A7-like [Labrus bergylta]|uniref:protocadherin gamma-A7-like n=1 Tax=Labrus bergylta TaxID=56723 RepID=UPI003313B6B4